MARPRRWLRFLAFGLTALLLVLVAAGGWAYSFARQSLPQVSGEIRLAGLSAPVTVYRDNRGVPHIEAANLRDLYMAQGYVTAQDRLWQLDMTRRAGKGELSAILGEGLLETDKYFRALMLTASAQRSVDAYSGEIVALMEAYAAGVNSFMQEAIGGRKLPVEFAILGYQPEPWSVLDSAVIGKLMADDLGGDWKSEAFRYQLRQVIDDALFREVLPTYPKSGITIMRHQAEAGAPSQRAALPPRHDGLNLQGLLALAPVPDPGIGSNNWVLSGKLTQSGKPLLANDPHLAVRTPGIWHQIHLRVTDGPDQMNVIGVMFAGVPGVVIGQNEQIAWGVTNTAPDVQDLYIEKRNPENPYQFEYKGAWEDAQVFPMKIKVKGKPDADFEVVVTRHGPILSEIIGDQENRPAEALALRWTAHLPTTEIEAIIGMNRARNWPQFREALKQFAVPTQNFVFAATDGTIAYRANGLIPIRAKGDGLVPVPGWTGEYEWTGYIPFDRMPEVVNPPEGFIATANNKVVDDAYPYLLGNSWAPPYRQEQIVSVLSSKTGFTVDEMVALQTDYTNRQAGLLLPVLLPQVEKAGLSSTELGALDLLKGWNFVEGAEQGAPLVYHFWWRELTRLLYEPLMGEDLYKRFSTASNTTDAMLLRAASGDESPWIAQAGGLGPLAVTSFRKAVAEVAAIQGKNPARWAWGEFHRIRPPHAIGAAVKPLGWFLNPPAYPVGGSGLTVGAMSFNRETGYVTSTAGLRQVVDLAAPTRNSYDIITPGQSGHFLSPWYKDQAGPHARGELIARLIEPDAYRVGSLLLLKP